MGAGAAPQSRARIADLTQIGIVAALPAEAAALIGRRAAHGRANGLAAGSDLRVAGVGAERARCSAQSLLDRGAQALVSWGFVGALAPQLRAGTLLLPGWIISPEGCGYSVDAAWQARLLAAAPEPCVTGDLLSVAAPVTTADAKAELYARTAALAVDMESAAIAAVAAGAGLPFVAVRAVVDEADMSLPPAALSALDAGGSLRPLALAVALLQSPRQIAALWRLAFAFNRGRATLSALAGVTGPRLAAL